MPKIYTCDAAWHKGPDVRSLPLKGVSHVLPASQLHVIHSELNSLDFLTPPWTDRKAQDTFKDCPDVSRVVLNTRSYSLALSKSRP